MFGLWNSWYWPIRLSGTKIEITVIIMTKLDEIENGRLVFYTATDGVKIQMSKSDSDLLIRAVRQLGAWRQLEVEDNPDVVNINPANVDPDVLELIAFDKRT